MIGMSFCPVVTDYALNVMAAAQRNHTRTGNMRIVVTATGVMVMEVIDVMVIYIPVPRGIERVVGRIVPPVVRRMPCYPSRSPKPVVYNGTIQINRFDDVVLAVQVRVTHYLHRDGLILLALYIDGCHVLIDVLCQHSLKDNETVLAFADLNHAEIIHIPVAVKVKVVKMALLRIEFFFELLKVVHFSEQSSYGTKVEALRDVLIGCRNGNRFIGTRRGK